MPRLLTSTELEEQARAEYRQGNYQAALATVRKVASSAPQLDLLVACLEKLEDYDGALANAKTLIRQYCPDPVGYFRSAHVLQKIGRPQAALKIYERGLKTVSKDHPSYLRMQQKHQQLAQTLIPATRSDPLSRLPLELVEDILRYLTFKQRISCIGVCKSWQKLLYSMPRLWTNLDLSQARKQVKPAFVNRCFSVSHHLIQEAWIGNVKKLDTIIEALAKRCNALSTLTVLHNETLSPETLKTLPMATNLSSLTLRLPSIKPSEVREILKGCRQLVAFECSGLRTSDRLPWDCFPERLQKLSLESLQSSSTAFINIRSIANHASSLKDLELKGWDKYDGNHEELDLSPLGSLERLVLGRMGIEISRLAPTLREVSGQNAFLLQPLHLPRLEKLDNLMWMHLLSQNGQPVSQLVSLTIPYPYFEKKDFIRQCSTVLQRLTGLKELRMREAKFVEVILETLEKMPALETIDLYASDITGYGVKQLVTKLPRLRRLGLEHCTSCYHDAIVWAREQGIEVITETVDISGRNASSGRVKRWRKIMQEPTGQQQEEVDDQDREQNKQQI
ncbi:hypothetical protein K461DRAFT_311682 [Myriangium duriaei CBS 260.36]|uniref:F-box domain-containing protein n=1 Tax=Myriangium duriaei CBS 260.36 TaxID=1168546 RepID=A0A9P4MJP1_9PEZI|nr:hypothetical protein K461DRAFT_311682 [Myriangium duriaei CBS 260.36]